MKESIKAAWEQHPLTLILFCGLFFRLIAVIFSKGYGMHDDHFLIIEPAAAWLDGYNYTHHWLPNTDVQRPDGFTLFYSGINYIVLLLCRLCGLDDPQGKMYVIRFLNALWSLLVIVYGYKIAERYAGMKVARQVGMILALLWFMPMFAVRNLVEVVCMPALLIATYYLTDKEKKDKIITYLWIGFWCGIAFNLRFQSALFIAGVGLIVLFRKNWKGFLMFAVAGIATVLAMQLVADELIWGQPFAELSAYIKYNVTHANDVITGGWYNYILLLGGLLIPPVSLFILFGYARSWKKYPELFWPTFLFFFFHSIFPNKQERFILPVVPVIIVLGCIGWNEYIAQSGFWQKRARLLKICWTFFWILNLIALPVISLTYSKRSRVESMCYLSKQKDLRNVMEENTNENDAIQVPIFYINKWDVDVINVTKKSNLAKAYYYYTKDFPKSLHPNYVIFFGKKNIGARVDSFKKVYPDAELKTVIHPSFIDQVMEFLNPVNKNENAYIYKFNPDGAIVPSPSDTISSGH